MPQVRQETLSNTIERDEICRSYVAAPDTSFPILEPVIAGFVVETDMEIHPDIGTSAPSYIMETFEVISILPYGQRSTYELLDASQIANGSTRRHATCVRPSASSIIAVATGRSSEDSSIDVSVGDEGRLKRHQVVTPTHGIQEGASYVWDMAGNGQDLVGIGGHFEGCKKFEMKAGELLESI